MYVWLVLKNCFREKKFTTLELNRKGVCWFILLHILYELNIKELQIKVSDLSFKYEKSLDQIEEFEKYYKQFY